MDTPKNSGSLRPYKDKLFIYMGKERGWKPQLSVLNCNKPRVWALLTDEKNSTFHFLERKEGKKVTRLIYLASSQEWVPFTLDVHTPSW